MIMEVSSMDEVEPMKQQNCNILYIHNTADFNFKKVDNLQVRARLEKHTISC